MHLVKAGKLPRRGFIQRLVAAGLTAPMASMILMHEGIAQTVEEQGAVLLKNAGGALPLSKRALKSIAVIGPRADSVHWDWYGGTPPREKCPSPPSARRIAQ